MILDNQRSPPIDRLVASQCKAVAKTAARTAANKAMPLFFYEKEMPSWMECAPPSLSGMETWRELLKTLKMDAQSNHPFKLLTGCCVGTSFNPKPCVSFFLHKIFNSIHISFTTSIIWQECYSSPGSMSLGFTGPIMSPKAMV